MPEKIQDRFVNKAYATVEESSVNTLTFAEIHTGLAMFEKVAWLVHRLEWQVHTGSLAQLAASSDILAVALVGNNQMPDLALDDPAVYDLMKLYPIDHGTPGNSELVVTPMIRDFGTLPGGGHIVPPRPIFIAVKAQGFATAAIVEVRISFTYLRLKPEEYWELVEATRIIK